MTFDIARMRRMHWAQTVQPIEPEVIAERFARDLVFLNDTSGELECASIYHEKPCTVEVTHLFERKCGSAAKGVCRSSADYVYRTLEEPGACNVCFGPVGHCWNVRPI